MSRDEPDSRDWVPPHDMRDIIRSLSDARRALRIDGDGTAAALESLIDAVEELTRWIAGARGR